MRIRSIKIKSLKINRRRRKEEERKKKKIKTTR